MKVLCALFLNSPDKEKIQALAESCFRLSTQVALSYEAVFIEIGNSWRLYNERGIKLRVLALSQRLSLFPQVGIGTNIPTALAIARFKNSSDLPTRALHDFATPILKDLEVSKKVENLIKTLENLGIHKLEDFIRLPRKAILTRFGKIGLKLHEQVAQAEQLPWPEFRPKEIILEKTILEADAEIKGLEPLLFVLRGLIDRSLVRLLGQGKRALKVCVRLKLEPYSLVKEPERLWYFEFSAPQGHVLGLLSILRERLERELQAKPLESPVTQITFEILESSPSTSAQRDFFNKKEEEQESWNSLISRLAEKLGPSRVFFAVPVEKYIPEKGWIMKNDRPLSSLASYLAFPERPLRLLREPETLYKSGENLFNKDKMWRIRSWEGPEILKTEWWVEKMERHYFKVDTHSGEDLWIFTIPGSTKVFLHGYFD